MPAPVATALAEAITSLDVRYGARTVTDATAAMDRARQRRSFTRTSFDRISGGLGPGELAVLTGEGTCGKVTLALRAVAGAQTEGGMGFWLDPARSFDALAAQRSGVDLRRLVVIRARARDEIVIAASAALRSEGARVVVIDLGPSFAQAASPDALAPLLPQVRGSTAALVVIADAPAIRVSLPTFVFERVGWESRHGRTTGWTATVRRHGDAVAERALLKTAV
jgi:predicted ATP-dependent serine protease